MLGPNKVADKVGALANIKLTSPFDSSSDTTLHDLTFGTILRCLDNMTVSET